MRTARWLIGVVTAVLLLGTTARAQQGPRERVRLDSGWRLALGHAADPARDFGFGTGAPWAKAGEAVGAARTEFDDSVWREVDLPHDWAVELPFVQDPDEDHTTHGSKPVGRRYPETTVGWYRKRFPVAAADEGKRVWVEFDGVFRDCHVWLNGHLLARNESGYIGFAFDATDYLNYGGENVLAVRADASHYEGWFYEGAGIYRHVWLSKTGPLHIARDGIAARTEITPDFSTATVTVETDIANEGEAAGAVTLRTRLIDPKGVEVAQLEVDGLKLDGRSTRHDTPRLAIAHPESWSPDHPSLYRVVTTVLKDGVVADEVTTRIGFRTAVFDKDRGFLLNGRPLKIQGVCCHQDHSGVGSALPDGLQYFRIARLKEMGVNGYRTSHHPPTPELLDACDELGMLVLDENRLIGSSDEILGQLRRFVRRDRNRPCVIAWSIGNEEPEQFSERGGRIAATMVRAIRELDPTRQTTYAFNSGNVYRGINRVVDVRGFNYFMDGIEPYHREHPEQPILGTETASSYYTRGEYAADRERGYVSAYDRNKPGYGATAAEWVKLYGSRDYLAGGFAWTGFDYRGEPSPYRWPCISSHFGIVDTCGFPKDVFYYHRAQWTDRSVLHLFPHWNWAGKEGQPIDVWCFTNFPRVQLLLNGKDLGSREVERYGHAEWSVPYEAGVLEAVGFKDGREAARTRVETTGKPVKLTLSQEALPPGAPDDVRVVTVSAVDDRGRSVPTASPEVTLALEGPGVVLGVGNGDPSSHEADRFIAPSFSRAVGGWQTAPLESGTLDLPPAPDLARLAWRDFDVSREAASIRRPGASAVFRTRLRVDEADQRFGSLALSFGRIDDEGFIFINGEPAAGCHDWRASPRVDGAWLHAGDNEIVVVVRNEGGFGGLGRGVLLTGRGEAPAPHRRLFNGLAQVLVQPRGAGSITVRASAEGFAPATLELRSPTAAP